MTRPNSRPSRTSDRRRRLQSDNLVLVPASQLPFKAVWNQLAQDLPTREALVVVTAGETPLKRVTRALVPELQAHGRHVTAKIVSAEVECSTQS